jgi:hypothetical protein
MKISRVVNILYSITLRKKVPHTNRTQIKSDAVFSSTAHNKDVNRMFAMYSSSVFSLEKPTNQQPIRKITLTNDGIILVVIVEKNTVLPNSSLLARAKIGSSNVAIS